MATPTASRSEQRYVGDTSTSIVHDTMHEDPTPAGCQIGKLIRSDTAVRFEPDRLRQAQAESFELCPRCFYQLDARPSQTIKKFS
jgi:hypothetical protein